MRRGGWWPVAIVAILALTVGANVWIYWVANDDQGIAIEPAYYQKAVAWDAAMAQARENRALGWRVTPSLAAFTTRDGANLRVTITDSTGAAISGATVRVSAFYNARAGDVEARQLGVAREAADVRVRPSGDLEAELVAREPRRRERERLVAGLALGAEALAGVVEGRGGRAQVVLLVAGVAAPRGLAEGALAHLGVAFETGDDRVTPVEREPGLCVGDRAERRLPAPLVVAPLTAQSESAAVWVAVTHRAVPRNRLP